MLRLRRQHRSHVVEVLGRLARLFETEPLVGFLWVADEERVRVRGAGLPPGSDGGA